MPVCRIVTRQGIEVRRFSTETLPIGVPITVGRSQSCTIALKHDACRAVSREHFTLEHRHLGWTLTNKSTHGIYRGDHCIQQTDVKPGDVFLFGGCFFCFGDEALPTRHQLHWRDPETAQEDFALLWPGSNTIGQAHSNAITLKDDSVSRQHARITASATELVVEDLNSFVGTFVGERRVTAPTPLLPDSQLRFGTVRAWIKEGEVVVPQVGLSAGRRRPVAVGKAKGLSWVLPALWVLLIIIVAVVLLAVL
jgi:pSer/pThr/pTyr-binding forkhead associated (FHA) protein